MSVTKMSLLKKILELEPLPLIITVSMVLLVIVLSIIFVKKELNRKK